MVDAVDEVGALMEAAVRASDAALSVLREPTPEGGVDDDRACVVSAFLASKQSGLLIVECVQRLLGSDAEPLQPEERLSLIQRSVEALLRTLLSTRHDGACEVAASALESVAEALLCRATDDDDDGHRALPASWLESLLAAAVGLGGERAVDLTYLRRSCGLPAAVRALLRAEQAALRQHRRPPPTATSGNPTPKVMSGKSQLDSPLLSRSLEHLCGVIRDTTSQGMQGAGVAGSPLVVETAVSARDAHDCSAKAGGASFPEWLRRVHCLNVLRLLYLDGSLTRSLSGWPRPNPDSNHCTPRPP